MGDKITGYRHEAIKTDNRQGAIGNRERIFIALWPIALILFSLFRVVFSIRYDKDNEGNNQYSCKNNIDTFHNLFLLFRWYSKQGNYKNNNCCHNKNGTAYKSHFFSKNAADKTNSNQILGDIHEHFTCFFSSVLMLHDFNYITKRGAMGDV